MPWQDLRLSLAHAHLSSVVGLGRGLLQRLSLTRLLHIVLRLTLRTLLCNARRRLALLIIIILVHARYNDPSMSRAARGVS